MRQRLRVLSPGLRTLVQDTGFRRSRRQGVPLSGVLDRTALAQVNALLDNPADTEALEIALTSPTLVAEGGPVRVAASGAVSGMVKTLKGDSRPLHPWTATTLLQGDTLNLSAPARGGTGLLGIGGGLDLPRVMGSRATFVRAGFGGLAGRALRAGDVLYPCPTPTINGIGTGTGAGSASGAGAGAGADRIIARPLALASGPIRVVLGPQREWFTDVAIETFVTQPYSVTPETDRMGMRLQGPTLAHAPGKGADIISDGIVPGAIQVPGTGRPIILLADAQTTGGYPKIATVISADLPRLAALVTGDEIRFAAVTLKQAEAAAREQRAALDNAVASICRAHRTGEIDIDGLADANLMGGVVDMCRPDNFPDHLYDPE